MANSVQFSIIGADALSKQLETLAYETKFKSGRFALRKAANVLADQVRNNALAVDDPETPEAIHLNVEARWNGRRYRASGDLAFRVGIMGGAGGNKTSEELASNPGLDTRHWRYVEFGTERAAPKPFFRRSMSETINQMTSSFVTNYQKSIDRALKRASRSS